MPYRRLWISCVVLLLGCSNANAAASLLHYYKFLLRRSTAVVQPWERLRGGGGEQEDVEIIEMEAVVTEENVEETALPREEESAQVDEEAPSLLEEEPALEEAIGSIENAQEEESSSSSEDVRDAGVDEILPAELMAQEDEESSDEVQLQKETEAARALAAQLRLRGKDLHDEGNWEDAANTFREASTILEEQLDATEELATCRLHEALCRLKQLDYAACAEACTLVLSGGETVPAAIQARAHHRRAKAKLGMDDVSGALQDARSAAFLGDRKAVALYGRLMRETSSSSLENDEISEAGASPPALLNDLFQGRNPFMPNDDASSALMESLLNKSGGPSSGSSSSPLGPLGDMASLLGNLGGKKKNGDKGGSLAKSVMKSLSKRLEEESTQDTICRYLKNTDTPQLQQLATMAGVSLTEGQASKLVSFCHGVTPNCIRKSIKNSKRVWYVVSVVRKTMQILSKYRHIIVLWVLLSWIKSALLRPIPINKRAARLLAMGDGN